MHQTTRLLRDLVALPSVNPMGRPLTGDHLYEHRVSAYLEEFFRGLWLPLLNRFEEPGDMRHVQQCNALAPATPKQMGGRGSGRAMSNRGSAGASPSLTRASPSRDGTSSL